MATRTERVEARIAPEDHSRLKVAADLAHTSVSSFLVAAGSEKAERLIAEHNATVVAAEFFDELLAALDAPPVANPALSKAAARRDEVVKRS
ncbi:MAG: DUF1778 domain-containing protein [Acidimicrobiia bacterium]|jgi:uncharacterized protein (DUF1778 family)